MHYVFVAQTKFQVAAQVASAQAHPSRVLPQGIEAPGPRPAVPIESAEYRAWYEKWYRYSQATGDMSYEEIQTATTTPSSSDNASGYAHETSHTDTYTEATTNSGFAPKLTSQPEDQQVSRNPISTAEYENSQDQNFQPVTSSNAYHNESKFYNSSEQEGKSYAISSKTYNDPYAEEDSYVEDQSNRHVQGRDAHGQIDDHNSRVVSQKNTKYPQGFRGEGDGDNFARGYDNHEGVHSFTSNQNYDQFYDNYPDHMKRSSTSEYVNKASSSSSLPSTVAPLQDVFHKSQEQNILSTSQSSMPNKERFGSERMSMPVADRYKNEAPNIVGHSNTESGHQLTKRVGSQTFFQSSQFNEQDVSNARAPGNMHQPTTNSNNSENTKQGNSNSPKKLNTELTRKFMMGSEGAPDQDAINKVMGAAMKNNPALVQDIMTKMSSGNMDSDAMADAMNKIMETAMKASSHTTPDDFKTRSSYMPRQMGPPDTYLASDYAKPDDSKTFSRNFEVSMDSNATNRNFSGSMGNMLAKKPDSTELQPRNPRLPQLNEHATSHQSSGSSGMNNSFMGNPLMNVQNQGRNVPDNGSNQMTSMSQIQRQNFQTEMMSKSGKMPTNVSSQMEEMSNISSQLGRVPNMNPQMSNRPNMNPQMGDKPIASSAMGIIPNTNSQMGNMSNIKMQMGNVASMTSQMGNGSNMDLPMGNMTNISSQTGNMSNMTLPMGNMPNINSQMGNMNKNMPMGNMPNMSMGSMPNMNLQNEAMSNKSSQMGNFMSIGQGSMGNMQNNVGPQMNNMQANMMGGMINSFNQLGNSMGGMGMMGGMSVFNTRIDSNQINANNRRNMMGKHEDGPPMKRMKSHGLNVHNMGR